MDMTHASVTFTVVVPSFNQGRFIDDTLRSLLDQHYPHLEILVIDGGSTDDTVERLRRYGGHITWLSENDDGQSDAIAKGFARAKHEWITWLNSDDVQCHSALWVVNDLISMSEDIDVVFGRGHYMDINGENCRPYPTIAVDEGGDVLRELFGKGYVAQPSVFFRKSAYERIGGIDRTLKFCMDYDLWVRLALARCRFASCPTDLSGNRWYEETKTSGQLLDLLAEVMAVQVKHFGRVSPYFVQAVSDNLYQKVHAKNLGDKHHLIYRTLYFKTVWLWFNARRPLYCIYGLFFESIAKSGPIVGDKLEFCDYWAGIKQMVTNKLLKR